MKFLRLFRKPKFISPLPSYHPISLKAIPAGSAVVFYGSPGNKVTELFGKRVYKHRYNPPAFHAALYLSKGDMLNVGKFRTIEKLADEKKDTRRVDVIVYKSLTAGDRRTIVANGRKDVSDKSKMSWWRKLVGDYAITDFFRFGIKWFKPSKRDFCSENVMEHFNNVGFHPSDEGEAYNTAPWDLVDWAEDHPDQATIYTFWEGDKFAEYLQEIYNDTMK